MSSLHILFWVICFIATFFFTGVLFLSVFNYKNQTSETLIKPYTEVFKSVSIGFVFWITWYSLIFSKGVSISWGFVLLFLIGLFYNRQHFREKKIKFTLFRAFPKEFLVLIIITAGVVFIQLIRNHFFNQTLAFYSLDDYYYYGYTADNMFKNRIEGINFNNPLLSDVNEYRVPYHYFDLWVNSFLHWIIPGNSIHIYLFVFIPIVCSLVFLGLLSVYESFNPKINLIAVVLCILLTFYFGVIPFKDGQSFPNVMLQPRTFISFWISCLSIIYFKESKYLIGALVICVLPFMNIMAAPGVLSAVFIFGGLAYWKSRDKIWLHFVTISVAVLSFVVLFYLVFGNPFSNASPGVTDIKQYFKNVTHFLFVDTVLRSCFFYLPLIIFIIANFKLAKNTYRRNRQIINLFTLVFVFTTLFSALATFNIEGSTIMFFPASALISVLATILVAVYMKVGFTNQKIKFIKTGFSFLLIVQLIFSLYVTLTPRFDYNTKHVSKKFINKLDSILPENSNVGYVLNPNYLKKNKWSDNPFLCRNVHFIGLLNKRINLFNLSAPVDSLKISTSMLSHDFIKSGDLYRFYESSHKDFRTNENIIDTFIIQNKIRYIVLDSGTAFNMSFKEMSHVISDSVSGFKLITLD